MSKEIKDQFEAKSKEVVEWLEKEYTGIRSGQATPALLDSVRVQSYGSSMSLNQISSIGIEDARTLRIVPWDASQISAIETAIRDSNLGLSLATDSAGVRAIFPELTSERRAQLLKLAKSKLEDARVSLRSVRDEVMKQLDKLEKDGEISEDEKFAVKESIQKIVEATNRTLENHFEKKETEVNG
jgi:ribosome recycling factor